MPARSEWSRTSLGPTFSDVLSDCHSCEVTMSHHSATGTKRLPPIPILILTAALVALSNLWSAPDDPALLFYLSGNNGFTADFARGDPQPSVIKEIQIISDGAIGRAFRCPHFSQVLAYWAPGNIYAQRGT